MSPLDLNTAMIIGTILVGINFFVYLPLGAYSTWKFWKLRDETFMKKRRPKLVVCSIIVIYIWMLICRTINQYDGLYLVSGHVIVYFVLANTGYICVVFVALRMWLLFYDYKRGQQLLSLQWKRKVDSTALPWTIKYKFLANFKYLMVFGLIYWIIIEIIGGIVISLFGYEMEDFAQMPYMISFGISMLYIAIRIRKFRDDYCIKDEMKIILFYWIGFSIVYVFCVVPWFHVFSAERVLLMTSLTSFTGFTCIIVWSLYPIYQLNKRNKLSLIDNKEDITTLSITFREFLSYKHGFELFANQLIREFSIENLLFLLEMVQIKKKIINLKLIDISDIGFMIDFDSKILEIHREENENIQNINDCFKNIGYIIDNYVDQYADYSVNLSAQTRKKILNATELIRNPRRVSKAAQLMKIGKNRVSQTFSQINLGIRRNSKRMSQISINNIQTSINKPVTVNVDVLKNVYSASHSGIDTIMEMKEENMEKTASLSVGELIDNLSLNNNMVDNTDNEDIILLMKHIHLIDVAMNEIYQLMRQDSYSRFAITDKHEKFVNNLNKMKGAHNSSLQSLDSKGISNIQCV